MARLAPKQLPRNPRMQYRRFGRTERELPVITLGGMRYAHGWEQPRDQVPADMLEQATRITREAFARGITHIETAHGYGKSETCYGKVLNQELNVPRSSYHLMTKGGAWSASDMRKLVEEQLKALQTDHIDLYAWHGINTAEISKMATAKGGPVEELLKLRDEGVIGTVGFSTHAPYEVIIDTLVTGMFDFVNLHYYHFNQRNLGAVAYAQAKDIGVFIISPNDKGGQLFNPSPRLTELCAPLSPIQFNARWCLGNPAVHTLSFGFSELAHFNELDGMFPATVPLDPTVLAIANRFHAALELDPLSTYEGWEFLTDPSGINIPEVLRMRKMWKCWGMENFGLYRYNMFEAKGNWFPGGYATEEAVAQVQADRAPPGVDLKAMLSEAHGKFYKKKG